jgi:CheY-like chemotaxis protein
MKKTKIIIVEDNNIIALDLKHSLEKLGYEIIAVVTSGEEALAQTLELKPDLVIMDIKLRDNMDGIEVARSIHTKECIPILFVSAYGDNETIQRAEKCADKIGYIVKPYNNDQLFSSVEKLLL